jgi:hypothetical protein
VNSKAIGCRFLPISTRRSHATNCARRDFRRRRMKYRSDVNAPSLRYLLRGLRIITDVAPRSLAFRSGAFGLALSPDSPEAVGRRRQDLYRAAFSMNRLAFPRVSSETKLTPICAMPQPWRRSDRRLFVCSWLLALGAELSASSTINAIESGISAREYVLCRQ